MPQNPVTDPITDQEIAFAHLVLSGTMNDRRAAEAVGLNPATAADTKSIPRVRDYMTEQRAAVREKMVDQEPEGLRNLTIGRDQVLARLWHLANLNPEATRGSIAGQIKAMSMIISIEGLIPNHLNDRRLSPVPVQPTPVKAQIYVAEPLRRQRQAEAERAQALTTVQAQPAAPQVSQAPPPRPAENAPAPNLDSNRPAPAIPSFTPEVMNRVPEAFGRIYDADVNPAGPLRLPMSLRKGAFARGRGKR